MTDKGKRSSRETKKIGIITNPLVLRGIDKLKKYLEKCCCLNKHFSDFSNLHLKHIFSLAASILCLYQVEFRSSNVFSFFRELQVLHIRQQNVTLIHYYKFMILGPSGTFCSYKNRCDDKYLNCSSSVAYMWPAITKWA